MGRFFRNNTKFIPKGDTEMRNYVSVYNIVYTDFTHVCVYVEVRGQTHANYSRAIFLVYFEAKSLTGLLGAQVLGLGR